MKKLFCPRENHKIEIRVLLIQNAFDLEGLASLSFQLRWFGGDNQELLSENRPGERQTKIELEKNRGILSLINHRIGQKFADALADFESAIAQSFA